MAILIYGIGKMVLRRGTEILVSLYLLNHDPSGASRMRMRYAHRNHTNARCPLAGRAGRPRLYVADRMLEFDALGALVWLLLSW
jgi:hypothetical protein